MRKRGLYCRPVSVCHVGVQVCCIHTAEDIVKLFSRPGSAIILVFFLTPNAGTQFIGKPFQQGAKYTGWDNFAIFD